MSKDSQPITPSFSTEGKKVQNPGRLRTNLSNFGDSVRSLGQGVIEFSGKSVNQLRDLNVDILVRQVQVAEKLKVIPIIGGLVNFNVRLAQGGFVLQTGNLVTGNGLEQHLNRADRLAKARDLYGSALTELVKYNLDALLALAPGGMLSRVGLVSTEAALGVGAARMMMDNNLKAEKVVEVAPHVFRAAAAATNLSPEVGNIVNGSINVFENLTKVPYLKKMATKLVTDSDAYQRIQAGLADPEQRTRHHRWPD